MITSGMLLVLLFHPCISLEKIFSLKDLLPFKLILNNKHSFLTLFSHSDQVFTLSIFFHPFKGDCILYFSALGSNQLYLADVVEILDDSSASVKKYDKHDSGNRITYHLLSETLPIIIDCKLVFKVGIKLTQQNTINSRVVKALSNYIL